MYSYFFKNWLSGRFTNWKICDCPPGYAKTNSPIESFNNCIKRDFTIRRRLSVPMAIDKLGQIVCYYGTENKIP